MSNDRYWLFLAVLVVASANIIPASAQAPQTDLDSDLQQGLKSFGTTHGSNIDSIDTTNTKLNVHIPLLSYGQLGNLHLAYAIHYDSPTFTNVCTPSGDCSYVLVDTVPHDMGSALVINDAFPGFTTNDIYSSHNVYMYTQFAVVDTDGETHHMGAIQAPAGNPTQQVRAVDGSGYYANVSTNWSHPSFYDSKGNIYAWGSSSTVKDVFNNQLTLTAGAIVDSVGRSIPAIPTAPNPGSGNYGNCNSTGNAETDWNVPGTDGNTVKYQFCWHSTTGQGGYLTQIILPNNTSWQFWYTPFSDQYGATGNELTEITLPTGGSISYSWTSVKNLGCGAGSPPSVFRAITARTVTDETGAHPWSYTWGSGFPGTRQLTITDPLGNNSVHTSTSYAMTSPMNVCQWKETMLQQYNFQNNQQVLLKTTVTTYLDTPPVTVLPSQIATTYNGQSYTTSMTYGAQITNLYWYGNKNSGQSDQMPNAYVTAHPISVTDGDYGGGTLRTTATVYQAFPSNSFNDTCPNSYCTANLLDLVQSVLVTGNSLNSAGTKNYYDAQGGTFGKLTSVSQLLSPGTYIPTATMTYYSTGELNTKADALGNTTTYVYDSKGLYPQEITNALTQHTYYTYDDNTGALKSVTDPNNNTTAYEYDEMNRITSASYPDGGSVGYSYNDSTPNPSVTVTQAITSTQPFSETEIVDALGRLVQTQLTSDPQGTDYVTTIYDALGRKASVTSAYRSMSEPTYGVTQYNYDSLNRLTSQIQPDGTGSTISYTYSGNITTVTDEAGKSRNTVMDGLGRLETVHEDPANLDYETDYTYDCLGNLWLVQQKGGTTNQSLWRTRTFVYDSLSRLTSATNPEAGTLTYRYDNTNTLTSKTDSRNYTITYAHDALHRITSKSYSNGDHGITYCYDGVQTPCGTNMTINNGAGRRTGMSDATGTTGWSYDSMGRTTLMAQEMGTTIFGGAYYQYNLDGSISYEQYPDGDIVQYAYNDAGRPITATYDDLGYGFNFVQNATYTAWGALTGYSNQTASGGVGATVAESYNKRLQPASISVTAQGTTIFSLNYNFSVGSQDNGNASGIANVLDPTRSETFTYDSLNRLYTAGTASTWGNTYVYDAWGNLLQKNPLSGRTMGESWTDTVNSNNQFGDYGYDPAGNMNSIDGVIYNKFNSENQWFNQSSYNITFSYDGDGHKVENSGGSPGTRYYGYDAAGRVTEDMTQQGTIVNEYLYFGGQRMAWVAGLSSLYYYYGDHLQTSRVITDDNGNKCYEADYFPWGGEENVFVNACLQNFKFTAKERDPDMSVDYFGARFYRYTMARFYSPDWSASPEAVPYSKLDNPQSLNLYTYVLDNPLSVADADGHEKQKRKDKEQSERDRKRVAMFLQGLTNLYIGENKGEFAAEAAAASPESGPAVVATGTAAAAATVSAMSSTLIGLTQVAGAVLDDTEKADQVANGLASSASISGLITTAVTGDAGKGATAASIEGISTGALDRSIFESPASLADTFMSILDVVSPPPAPPSPPAPKPPSN